MIELQTLTSILPQVAPEVEAVQDGTRVGFYRLKSGPYGGITYTYANVQIPEPEPDQDCLVVKFQYVIMEDRYDLSPKTDVQHAAFRDYVGDILVRIIDAAVNAQDYDEPDS